MSFNDDPDLAEGQVETNQHLQNQRAERLMIKRQDAFRSLMATAEGRRWVWWLLERCGVFRCSFTGDNATFFNEGTRNVGLMVIADIHELCPAQFATMMTEAKDPNL